MKKKLVFLGILLLSLTGCTTQYNLEFSNGSIKEEIITTILPSDIPTKKSSDISEVDDRVTPFIENDQYPLVNNTKVKYKKKVKKSGNDTIVSLSYNYNHDEFRNSSTFRSCFRNYVFDEQYKGYTLNFSGDFYCLYGNEVVINIKTNNKVLSHNADKVSGNTYSWVINRENLGKVKINMEISKKTKITSSIIYVIVGIIAVVLCVFGFIVLKKIKNKDSINEI